MRTNPLDSLPRIPKSQAMQEYRAQERAKRREQEAGSQKNPTMALRFALSVFGAPPREGVVPLKFFAQENIQVYIGLPCHPLNRLFLFTRQTTARKIADEVFPKHRDSSLPFDERFATTEGLPAGLVRWLKPIQTIMKRIEQESWNPPPVYVLSFEGEKDVPWIARAEHLCGQVLDGTHRVLAYALLGLDLQDINVLVRVCSIQPVLLAFLNCLTIMMRFIMDPFHTSAFIKKRFGASACFAPLQKLLTNRLDSEESPRESKNPPQLLNINSD